MCFISTVSLLDPEKKNEREVQRLKSTQKQRARDQENGRQAWFSS